MKFISLVLSQSFLSLTYISEFMRTNLIHQISETLELSFRVHQRYGNLRRGVIYGCELHYAYFMGNSMEYSVGEHTQFLMYYCIKLIKGDIALCIQKSSEFFEPDFISFKIFILET